MSLSKIKTVLGDDIRRFEVTDRSYESLEAAIRNSYSLADASPLVMSFVDDEGDMVQISSTPEFQDALEVAVSEGKRVLKLFVSTDGIMPSSAPPSSVPSEVGDMLPKTAFQPETPRAAVPLQDDHETKADVAATPTQTPKPDKSTIMALVQDLLSNQEVVTSLPQAIQAALSAVSEGEGAQSVVDTFIASSDALLNHPAVQQLVSFLPLVLRHVEKGIEFLRSRADILGMARNMAPVLPMFIPQLLQQLQQFAAGGGCGFTAPSPNNMGPLAALMPMLAGLGMGPGLMFPDVEDPEEVLPQEVTPTDATPRSSQNETKQQEHTGGSAVHANIECDGCGQHPLVGDRFKCLTCTNFDLCSACEAKGNHPEDHPLLKLRAPPVAGPPVHHGIICDGCNARPITGVRFKCATCPDFDLCDKCEADGGKHPVDHPLIKMKVPVRGRGRRGPWGRGGWRRHGGPLAALFRGPGPHHGPGPRGPPHHGPHHGPAHHGPHHRHRHGGRHGGPGRRPHSHGRCRGGRGFGRHVAKAAAAVASAVSAAATAAGNAASAATKPKPRLSARHVEDVNLTDRSEVAPDQVLVKTWRLENDGREAWPKGTKLIFLRGDEIAVQEEFDVSAVAPGDIVEVSALVRTPPTVEKKSKEEGQGQEQRVTAYFRLADANRQPFGPRLWVDVLVVSPAKLQDTVSNASSDVQEYVKVEEPQSPESPKQPEAQEEPQAQAAAAPAPVLEAKTPPAEVLEKYAMQLQILSSIGFRDHSAIIPLLDKHDGDVQQTYNELVAQLAE